MFFCLNFIYIVGMTIIVLIANIWGRRISMKMEEWQLTLRWDLEGKVHVLILRLMSSGEHGDFQNGSVRGDAENSNKAERFRRVTIKMPKLCLKYIEIEIVCDSW